MSASLPTIPKGSGGEAQLTSIVLAAFRDALRKELQAAADAIIDRAVHEMTQDIELRVGMWYEPKSFGDKLAVEVFNRRKDEK